MTQPTFTYALDAYNKNNNNNNNTNNNNQISHSQDALTNTAEYRHNNVPPSPKDIDITVVEPNAKNDINNTIEEDSKNELLDSITSSMNGLYLDNKDIKLLFQNTARVTPATKINIQLRKVPNIKFNPSIFKYQKAQLTEDEQH